MKKITLLLNIFLLSAIGLNAQNDVRTINTRIADLLAQMPANNENDLKTAMGEMEKFGVDGLYQLTKQMVPLGAADNSKAEYAIMGYTTWVSAPGRKELKEDAEEAWIKALSNSDDKQLKIFIMDMLQIIGTNRSVPALEPCLNDKFLCLKAAPVLASIGTPEAGKTLLDALQRGNNISKIALIQAMGDMKYAAGLDHINNYALNGNIDEKKAALFALAQMGSPASESVLLNQTKANGKYFEDKEATADYGLFIKSLSENGNLQRAIELAESFVKNATNSNIYAKAAALSALTLTIKSGAMPALSKAAFDQNEAYRNAALNLAAPFVDKSNIGLFTKKLKSAPVDIQASLVYFLRNHSDLIPASTLKTIGKFAKQNTHSGLKHAAIMTLAQSNAPGGASQLLNVLRSSSESDMNVLTKAFLLLEDKSVVDKILAFLPKTSGIQKSTLLNVLAVKKSNKAFAVVLDALHSSDKEIYASALKALPAVSNKTSLPQLFDLLQNSTDNDIIAAAQQTISSVLKDAPDAGESVINHLTEFPVDKQYLLYPAMSTIGNQKALKIVEAGYKNGDNAQKANALDALVNWSNADAMPILYSIASTDKVPLQKNQALKGYIDLIQTKKAPPAQKLLLLKKAMSAASDYKAKALILKETSSINTFPALAFAASYLDDQSLKQSAAATVMSIGLSDKSFYGTLVRQWLTKAMHALDGQDAVYMKKSIQKFLDDMPDKEGYVALFNGKDLTRWKGLVANPIKRREMNGDQLMEAQQKADEEMRSGWIVKDGALIFTGKGNNIATTKDYGDFEMLIDWKIFNDGQKDGDAGIYLRGTPQVQIWDTSRTNVGAQVGSGGLYNNKKYESKPLVVADNPLGTWNHFYIKMVGNKVTVYLNGVLVTDNVPMENYWDRGLSLWPSEQIELQAHGSRIGYRDIYIKELNTEKPFQLSDEERKEGFEVLFDGTNLDKWQGNKTDYVIENGVMVVKPQPGSRGNLYTKEEYKDFIFRFEFKLTPGANNGLGIRAPLEGDAAYVGMELQILDNTADIYKDLEPYQYHGSVYGVIPAKRGFLKPVGEWNYEEVIVKDSKIQVILNGVKIVDGDISDARKHGTMDHKDHPGLKNEKGHIGFLGHGSVVYFRNIRVKELK